jgi:hypothetical protein
MGIDLIGSGFAPGRHLPRSHFRPWRVQELDAGSRRCGRPRQGLGRRNDLSGDLGPPVGQILGYCKGNRYKLEPTDFTHQCSNGGHEAARLSRKDLLEGLALPHICTRINVEAKRQPCLPGPDVAIKLRDTEDIEAVKPDVPVCPLTDVVGQDAFTVIVGWWLCELARTRDVTASHVEPIPLHPPLRNICHDCTPFLQQRLQRHAARVIRGCGAGSHENAQTVFRLEAPMENYVR